MTGRPETEATRAIRKVRDFLLEHRLDYDTTIADFAWPQLDEFNFALEWFDVVAAEHPYRPAVTIVSADLVAQSWSYAELARRSDQVANWLRMLGLGRGSKLIVMLNNSIEIWEILLAIYKIGAVAIPTSTLLSATDLAYRVEHGEASAVVAPTSLRARLDVLPTSVLRIGVGADNPPGWISMSQAKRASDKFVPDGPTPAGDLSLLYFTSGTTSRPKLVRHTHVSYPVGHLSTMWWLGVQPGDVHLNISSPGWGKHAWSNFFAPFLAQATVFVFNYDRFDAATLMKVMDAHQVTTFCAPPTVWRMLIQADLTQLSNPPRELLGAGEPLNPEVITRVREAWGGTIRDGFGQTEMTCCVGNSPGQLVKDGSMGRPMPGYPVVLLDPVTGEERHDEGEICLNLAKPILGLMDGYHNDAEMTAQSCRDGYYHTGDIASVDADGYLTYVGRADDVFKASDYKISPFELESILLEHPYVTEVAIVPSPDPLRAAVPKAFVCLVTEETIEPHHAAREIFEHARNRLSAYQRVKILEFVTDLPKTISGKIRRVELREREAERVAAEDAANQFLERDFR
ncbi:AMP-binding protein [Propionicimonas sp.]|uniref:AMP-binding protein n=1 Tax=Propionicimonas sp. TaxID=1955623 RepID=UPI0018441186|nr:AMP-binding protein [Propionicimonas sp.]MBU3977043.1 AMP-binding protein [Actinomycetota bacterium]MBA3020613.1 AMP-binding protein [Propionicimonas sp.]MBU3984983.1 AMP-binding protein [Actinomycetota bacterium]MBU4007060.1 AMP-binding protein [Actinomycetota bacterium]MBU4064813.1 AMP-binding protein [Actinomycetota bacterium]